MIKRIFKWILTVIGIAAGSELAYLSIKYFEITNLFGYELKGFSLVSSIVMGGLITGIIIFLISPWIINLTVAITSRVEKLLQSATASEIVVGIVGLIVGLVIAYLISSGPINLIPIPWLAITLSIMLYGLSAYLGISISSKKREDLLSFANQLRKSSQKDREKSVKQENKVTPKILDTSVIIDGRIADICRTGFVEGPLVIPSFVLEELRHIADSSDSLKRNRGRRGLDILNKIQNELEIPVEIIEKDFEELSEVDTKLLKLAQVMSGSVVTNDYNLNKVAEFQRVPVLNINELANAVKPVVLPGEEMVVLIIKDGKESGQGIAYLDDGTMIVVDGGKKYIGETIEVIVTSVLQTAAGRMIFVKPKSAIDKVS
ncbi:MAG: twitching motility protein PilT [Clostridiales bacterium GWB2_37_7]|nr:MAG: twitching motility protein PilT [Clostridiales bacterium GWB2_37_7]